MLKTFSPPDDGSFKPCSCGFNSEKHNTRVQRGRPSSKYCPNINKLDNHIDCPSFLDVCHENEPDAPYYRFTDVLVLPARYWCMMGEIEEVNLFIRPRIVIRTRFNETFPIAFYLDRDQHPTTFSFHDAVVGHVMVILYPAKHDFLDMTTGIRQEDPDTVVIFKCSMQELIKIFASMMMNPPVCFQCQATQKNSSTPESLSLKQCSKCRIALYCSQSCQVQHWKSNHKNLCSSMKYLQKLRQLDFTRMNRTPTIDYQYVTFA